jgi:hypothetical protein
MMAGNSVYSKVMAQGRDSKRQNEKMPTFQVCEL